MVDRKEEGMVLDSLKGIVQNGQKVNVQLPVSKYIKVKLTIFRCAKCKEEMMGLDQLDGETGETQEKESGQAAWRFHRWEPSLWVAWGGAHFQDSASRPGRGFSIIDPCSQSC